MGILRKARQPLPLVKKLIWTYLFLLVFEGALRKWVLPSLSGPLLIIRDPLGVWILWEAIRTGRWSAKWSMYTGGLTAVLSILVILQLLHDPSLYLIEIFGLRSYLLTFPVAFAISSSFSREDVMKAGKIAIYLSIPMAVIYYFQYQTETTSWWNMGAYEGGAQISYVGSHVRAAGTFSFVTGPIHFQTIVFAFILYFLDKKDQMNKMILWSALGLLIVTVPMVGARTLVVYLGLTVLMLIISGVFGVGNLMSLAKILVPTVGVLLIAMIVPAFQESMQSLTARFDSASASQGSFDQEASYRYSAGMTNYFQKNIDEMDLLGQGMGSGAAAVTALTAGRAAFNMGEDDFSRSMNEMGLIVGLSFFVFRLFLVIQIAMLAFRSINQNDMLPGLLLPLAAVSTLYDILEQPMAQGFLIVMFAFMHILTSKPLKWNALPQVVTIKRVMSRRNM